MVAISLYRGNLHKVSNEPRRWAAPPRNISPAQFRALLSRRTRALSALNPVPALNGNNANDLLRHSDLHQQPVREQEGASEPIDRTEDSHHRAMEVENVDTIIEEIEPSGPITNRKKRKFELEKKLENLNQEKHHLVQTLKQILNAEEEIKRRQAPVAHPPVVGQVEASANMGFTPRQTPQRVGSDVNLLCDSQGEPGNASTSYARTIQSMPVTSPSPDSPCAITKTGSNRLASAMGNPSRFAPSASHAHPTSLPPLLVSGMQFTASTPSPGGSTGTPTFRDALLNGQSWSQR